MTDLSDPIAALRVSPGRRVLGTGVQIALGLVLIGTAGRLPQPSILSVLVLVGTGILALVLALRFWRLSGRDLILTREGVFDSTGTEIARLDQIADVDRGFFAFKPSNGFLMRLKTPHPRAWVPGLWWRVGTRVGIGGSTSGKAARDMADVIKVILADPASLDRISGSDPDS